MNFKNIAKILLGLSIALVSSCETYPDWQESVEYSDTYPVSGEYIVVDYDENGDSLLDDGGNTFGDYSLFIFNKAYNPTGDSIWIDNYTSHPSNSQQAYPYKFKIKAKANLNTLTFDCNQVGVVIGSNLNPLPNSAKISIKESLIIDYNPGDITSSKPDSIRFVFEFYDATGTLIKSITTAGHRKTGWEHPEDDDAM